MSEPTNPKTREYLPSANKALAELEEVTGKPVLLLEEPDLNVLATISRASINQSSHILRIKEGSDQIVDYLITFECKMALRDGIAARQLIIEKKQVREKIISEMEKLHRKLPLSKTRELGKFIYNGLITQLRSIGPGLGVDRWIRLHCSDLQDAQSRSIEAEINKNIAILQAPSKASFPEKLYKASVLMNAAYAIHNAELLGKSHLGVPYISQGYGDKAKILIKSTLDDQNESHFINDRQIIDDWASELGITGWYDWLTESELTKNE